MTAPVRPRQPLAIPASFSGGQIMVVKITPNDKGNPVGKLADAELHFSDGALEGLKLIGFAIWERRGGVTRRGRPAGRVAVVTAARRRFGRAITLDVAREGARVPVKNRASLR